MKKYIYILPYLSFNERNEELKFKLESKIEITIFSSKHLSKYINNQNDLKAIQAILDTYKPHNPNEGQLGFQGIIKLNNFDLRQFNSSEKQYVSEVIRLLFVSHLSYVHKQSILEKKYKSHTDLTADNFKIDSWSLSSDITNPSLVTDGFIVPIERMNSMPNTIIQIPAYTPMSNHWQIDDELCQSLQKLKKDHSQLYDRIMNSIESIMSGYYNGINYERSQILLSITAFVLLFGNVDRGEQFKLKSKFKDLFGEKHQKFIADLYKLRNKIIHGKKISDDELLSDGISFRRLAVYYWVWAINKLCWVKLNEQAFMNGFLDADRQAFANNIEILTNHSTVDPLLQVISSSGRLNDKQQCIFLKDNLKRIFELFSNYHIDMHVAQNWSNHWQITTNNLTNKPLMIIEILKQYKVWLIKRMTSSEYLNLQGEDQQTEHINQLLFPDCSWAMGEMMYYHYGYKDDANRICKLATIPLGLSVVKPDSRPRKEIMDIDWSEVEKSQIKQALDIDSIFKQSTKQYLFPDFRKKAKFKSFINELKNHKGSDQSVHFLLLIEDLICES